jgi:methylated-DNA-[protein]-cysteine S-methyltransferase
MDIARELGSPGAVRAVGAANGANPLPIVIPCHRVVATGGGMGGYGGGIDLKRRLLALEGAILL